MSSILAHGLAAGTLIGAARLRRYEALGVLGFAILPDLDYALRLAGLPYDAGVRISHSLFVVAAIWALVMPAALAAARALRLVFRPRAVWLCLISGLGAVGLDWLIGSAWGDPVFWPFSAETHSSPFGILPSSPKPSMSNVHFWKNATIELLVFVPVFLMVGCRWRGVRALALIAPLALGLAWGISLPR